jgi:hypothetical protein
MRCIPGCTSWSPARSATPDRRGEWDSLQIALDKKFRRNRPLPALAARPCDVTETAHHCCAVTIMLHRMKKPRRSLAMPGSLA